MKPTRENLVRALEDLAAQADQDCPSESRSEHFKQALYDALILLEDEDGVERHTYANPQSLETHE